MTIYIVKVGRVDYDDYPIGESITLKAFKYRANATQFMYGETGQWSALEYGHARIGRKVWMIEEVRVED